jgi:hypothetical protein
MNTFEKGPGEFSESTKADILPIEDSNAHTSPNSQDRGHITGVRRKAPSAPEPSDISPVREVTKREAKEGWDDSFSGL